MRDELKGIIPKDFAVSEGEKAALPIVECVECDTDDLQTPLNPSREEARQEFTRTVLQQTPIFQSIPIEKVLVSPSSASSNHVVKGTAVKSGEDVWTLFIDGEDEPLSTDQFLQSQTLRIVEENCSRKQSESQAHKKRRSKNRLRKEAEERRVKEASQIANERLEQMLHAQYLKTTEVIKEGKFTFEVFRSLEPLFVSRSQAR